MLHVALRLETLALAALMALAFALRVASFDSYPLHEDELISIRAAEGVLATGLPSRGDSLYARAPLVHYAIALALQLAGGTSVMAARIVPTLASVLLLPLAWLLGCRLAGRPAGWAAALFLAFSSFQNHHAAFARFYLPFQLAFLATVILAGSVFIAGRRRAAGWLLAAIAVSVGSHEQAIAIVPVLALAVLLARDRAALRAPRFLLGLGACGLAWGVLFWLTKSGGPSTLVELRLGAMPDKWYFVKAFATATPFASSLVVLGGAALASSDPRLDRRLWLYAASVLALSLLLVSLFSPWESARYAAHLYPLFVVLAAASAVWCVRRLVELARQRPRLRPSARLALGLGCVLAALVGAVSLDNHRLASGFGHLFKSPDQKPAHDVLAGQLRPGDVIVTLEPSLTRFYLGRRPDYFLREKYDRANARFVPFSEEARQSAGVPLLDRPEALEAVLATGSRVWLYANHKLSFTTSRATQEVIARHFTPVHGWKKNSGSVLFVREAPEQAAER